MIRLTRSVKASDVMTRDVASVAPDTSLKEVAEIMAHRKISGVPVVAADGTVVGDDLGEGFPYLYGLGVRQQASWMW